MFTLSYDKWFIERYWPLMGREEDDEETPAGGGEEESTDPPAEEEPAGGAGSEEESSSDDDEEDEENDADEDELGRVRGERDKLRSQLASAEAAAQKAKKEARKAREDAAKKGGNWEQVAKEREAELQEANERATESEKRAILAEENLDKFQREVRITRLATKLSYRDPEDAISQLAKTPEVTGDDKACERALRKLADSKPYLVDQRRARGRAMGDGNGEAGLTHDQLKDMTPEEINARWDSGQVPSALVRGPSRG